ncbi:hypothetical protein B5E91_08980 [Thomasclavelia spiroformis]|uniref:Glycosyltransferase subfamily 4-like N-terminal domain-containing protein n=1 Tax=Thomasclavelia spiroformis TaxID=29348 RepID=A0A1Y4QKK8_9FIRM|nr:hypothetical protein B5E91_08980 [Thomasclavelia spiroformis]
MRSDFLKILIVNGGMLDYGGISAYIMNYYRKMDKKDIIIDFIVQGDGKCLFVDEINNNGGKVFVIPNKSQKLIAHIKKLNYIIKTGNYDIVHAHADAANGLILKIAKKNNIKVRISHCHSTNFFTKSKIKIFFNKVQKKMIFNNANYFWGCSDASCQWLYDDNNYEVINNAIDIEKFRFNNEKRKEYRELLNTKDSFCICQIGHFNYIKNQMYTIKIITELKKNYPTLDFKFYFIGSGLDSEINKLNKLITPEIKENIIFLGRRNDVFNILQAMDLLLMPSIFEGFPVSLVESQAAGIKAIVSKNITDSVSVIPGLIKFLKIDDSDLGEWVENILKSVNYKREDTREKLTEKGFNIEIEAKKLRDRYDKLIEVANDNKSL